MAMFKKRKRGGRKVLAKGYRYAKGGRVIKVKAKAKARRKTRRRRRR